MLLHSSSHPIGGGKTLRALLAHKALAMTKPSIRSPRMGLSTIATSRLQQHDRSPSSTCFRSSVGILVILVATTTLTEAFSVTSIREQRRQVLGKSGYPSFMTAQIRPTVRLWMETADHDNAGTAPPDDDHDDDDNISTPPSTGASFKASSSSSWSLENDFDHFLNQVTIQSFLFLLMSLRDVQTVRWIERFTEPNIITSTLAPVVPPAVTMVQSTGSSSSSKLLSYHGLAAMNTTKFPTWESYFEQLLQQPAEVFWIESDRPHAPQYELEINPASLCSRIMSVREQIAREFIKDLAVIATMGTEMMERYWQNIKKEENTKAQDRSSSLPFQSMWSRDSDLLFLDFDPDEESDYAPSPLRKGNFDLLTLLATQESIYRVLNRVPQDNAERSTREFLSNFYFQRQASHFVGNKRYGRADDFIHELLSTPPVVVQISEDLTALIDPMAVAEQVLQEREHVTLEWLDQVARMPEMHMPIKRIQLNHLMGVATQPTKSSSSSLATEPSEPAAANNLVYQVNSTHYG